MRKQVSPSARARRAVEPAPYPFCRLSNERRRCRAAGCRERTKGTFIVQTPSGPCQVRLCPTHRRQEAIALKPHRKP